jgi:cell division septal protein FtsQ
VSRQARSRKRGTGHAAKPRKPVRARLAVRLPSRARIGAFLLFAALVGGMVTLVNGPWLRVVRTVHAGERYTPAEQLDAVLSGYVGQPLLALDSAAVEAQLRSLPAVAEARVGGQLPDALAVTIVEKRPAATWLTQGARLVLGPDGAVIGSLPRTGELPPELESLPAVEDRRSDSRALTVGAAVPLAELRAAERLLSIDPELVGSRARGFTVRIDDEYGFVLASDQPSWEAALGFYQAVPGETQEEALARLEAQLTAVRTLFAERPERSVGWVDARNPGKVYWSP